MSFIYTNSPKQSKNTDSLSEIAWPANVQGEQSTKNIECTSAKASPYKLESIGRVCEVSADVTHTQQSTKIWQKHRLAIQNSMTNEYSRGTTHQQYRTLSTKPPHTYWDWLRRVYKVSDVVHMQQSTKTWLAVVRTQQPINTLQKYRLAIPNSWPINIQGERNISNIESMSAKPPHTY